MTTQPPAPTETRVVLAKPGDLLLVGNVGAAAFGDVEPLAHVAEALQDALGIQVVFFAEDIRLDLLPPGAPGA